MDLKQLAKGHGGAREGAGRPALTPAVKDAPLDMTEVQPVIQQGLSQVAVAFPDLIRKMIAACGKLDTKDQKDMAKFLIRMGADLIEDNARFAAGEGDQIIKEVKAVEIKYGPREQSVAGSGDISTQLSEEVRVFREVTDEVGQPGAGEHTPQRV